MRKIINIFWYILNALFYNSLGMILSGGVVSIFIVVCIYYQQPIIGICLLINYFVLIFISNIITYKQNSSIYRKHSVLKGSNECACCGKPMDDWIGKYDPCPGFKTTYY